MRRHLTAYILAVGCLAVSSVVACGHRTADPQHTVSIVVPDNQMNYAVETMDGFRTGVDAVGHVKQVVVGPSTLDGPGELRLFNSVPKSARDGVAVLTLSPKLFNSPMASAAQAGVPVIAVDNPPDPSSHVSLFVGNDNYQLGQMLADEVINKLPADASGKVVIGTPTPQAQVLDQRARGIRDEFAKRLPKITVVGPVDTEQDVAANLTAWEILVRSNPDALAFLGTGDADGWNLDAIRENVHGTWLAGAYDLDPRSLTAVKEGHLLLVSPEHFIEGAVAGRLEADHASRGTPLPHGWILTPGLAVTPANVDAVIARQASLAARQAWFAPEINEILTNLSRYLRPLPGA